MFKCPKNKDHITFRGTAHVTQGWEMNTKGTFIDVIEDCIEVMHAPNKEDCITCSICGADAIWEEE